MTKIKMCGLMRPEDISVANAIRPDYIGFVFAKKSRRYVTPELAAELKAKLNPEIKAVGVFVDAPASEVAGLLQKGIIDIAQLHGSEDEMYAATLRELRKKRRNKPETQKTTSVVQKPRKPTIYCRKRRIFRRIRCFLIPAREPGWY